MDLEVIAAQMAEDKKKSKGSKKAKRARDKDSDSDTDDEPPRKRKRATHARDSIPETEPPLKTRRLGTTTHDESEDEAPVLKKAKMGYRGYASEDEFSEDDVPAATRPKASIGSRRSARANKRVNYNENNSLFIPNDKTTGGSIQAHTSQTKAISNITHPSQHGLGVMLFPEQEPLPLEAYNNGYAPATQTSHADATWVDDNDEYLRSVLGYDLGYLGRRKSSHVPASSPKSPKVSRTPKSAMRSSPNSGSGANRRRSSSTKSVHFGKVQIEDIEDTNVFPRSPIRRRRSDRFLK